MKISYSLLKIAFTFQNCKVLPGPIVRRKENEYHQKNEKNNEKKTSDSFQEFSHTTQSFLIVLFNVLRYFVSGKINNCGATFSSFKWAIFKRFRIVHQIQALFGGSPDITKQRSRAVNDLITDFCYQCSIMDASIIHFSQFLNVHFSSRF